MNLFVGTMAFAEETSMAQVRLGDLVVLVISGLVVALVLKFATNPCSEV